MNEFNGLLTIVVFLPLAVAAGIALLAKNDRQVKFAAAAAGLAQLVLSIVVFINYDGDERSCSLCLTDIATSDLVVRLVCRHMFHEGCMTNYAAHAAADVDVEYRDGEEVLHFDGRRQTVEGVTGLYPAFDITPPDLIYRIVTDRGAFLPENVSGYFDAPALPGLELSTSGRSADSLTP